MCTPSTTSRCACSTQGEGTPLHGVLGVMVLGIEVLGLGGVTVSEGERRGAVGCEGTRGATSKYKVLLNN